MLKIARKVREGLVLHGPDGLQVRIYVDEVRRPGGTPSVALVIDAPQSVEVWRDELLGEQAVAERRDPRPAELRRKPGRRSPAQLEAARRLLGPEPGRALDVALDRMIDAAAGGAA